MIKLKAGDRVSCKLKESRIINNTLEHDNTHVFEIIGVNEGGYYLYIPPYFFVKNTFKIDQFDYKKYKIAAKYIGDDCIHIPEDMILNISFILKGLPCRKCEIFFDYAESNQPDGSLVCYSCRFNNYR
jgi:hypothetical protein